MRPSSRVCFVAFLGLSLAFALASPSDVLAQRRRARRARPPAPAPASQPGIDPQIDREARQLFLAGEAAYDSGRYEAALEYFTRAHALSGRPGLLFNIASVSERLRRDDEALGAYEQYLRELPEAPNREFTEQRIAFLREQIAQDAALRDAAARAALPEPLEREAEESAADAEAEVATAPSGTSREELAVRDVELAAPPPPAVARGALDVSGAAPRDEGVDLAEEWWFWTIVGVAVVGAGVGVGAAVAAASDDGGGGGSPAVTGDFGPGGVVIALEAF